MFRFHRGHLSLQILHLSHKILQNKLTTNFFAGKIYAQEIQASAEEIPVKEIKEISSEGFLKANPDELSAEEISKSENKIEKFEEEVASESEENFSPKNSDESKLKEGNSENENLEGERDRKSTRLNSSHRT